ncbi:TPA: hypothetical protein HA318_03320, partial [Candidatus Micrarchaeota archaeon]|nr:hypothetical protein [Candidatus Micrarchaeota archaeon]
LQRVEELAALRTRTSRVVALRRNDGLNEGYAGVLNGKKAFLQQDGNNLQFSEATAEEITRFIALDHDLPAIMRGLSKDAKLAPALKAGKGIRILRQDPWECAISFVVSQNSNIPRIEATLQKIREEYGNALGEGIYSFPSPARLSQATLLQLQKLGLGYRAQFVKNFADHVSKHGDFNGLHGKPYADARRLLMNHLGIGPKIADCICLYGLQKLEAFPVDVWIKRVMTSVYGKEITRAYDVSAEKVSAEKIAEFGRKRFGEFAGYAQLYLFQWERNVGKK